MPLGEANSGKKAIAHKCPLRNHQEPRFLRCPDVFRERQNYRLGLMFFARAVFFGSGGRRARILRGVQRARVMLRRMVVAAAMAG